MTREQRRTLRLVAASRCTVTGMAAGQRCPHCRWESVHQLISTRPPDSPTDIPAIRARCQVARDEAISVQYEHGEFLHKRWKGCLVQAVYAEVRAIPSWLGSPPWTYWSTYKKAPIAILRWRLWSLDGTIPGFLEGVWEPGVGPRWTTGPSSLSPDDCEYWLGRIPDEIDLGRPRGWRKIRGFPDRLRAAYLAYQDLMGEPPDQVKLAAALGCSVSTIYRRCKGTEIGWPPSREFLDKNSY
jgi:hypothetical protein